jgi:hypothetical protein
MCLRLHLRMEKDAISETLFSIAFDNTGRWSKTKNLGIPSVIYHRQNPLESTFYHPLPRLWVRAACTVISVYAKRDNFTIAFLNSSLTSGSFITYLNPSPTYTSLRFLIPFYIESAVNNASLQEWKKQLKLCWTHFDKHLIIKPLRSLYPGALEEPSFEEVSHKLQNVQNTLRFYNLKALPLFWGRNWT